MFEELPSEKIIRHSLRNRVETENLGPTVYGILRGTFYIERWGVGKYSEHTHQIIDANAVSNMARSGYKIVPTFPRRIANILVRKSEPSGAN